MDNPAAVLAMSRRTRPLRHFWSADVEGSIHVVSRPGMIRQLEPRVIRRTRNLGYLAVTQTVDRHICLFGVEGSTEEEAVAKFYAARESWARLAEQAQPATQNEHS